MIRCALQRLVKTLRRKTGWRHWAIAFPVLIILACAGTSLGPQKCQPDQHSDQLFPIAADIQDVRLHFVPVSGSRVGLQGTATIGTWKSQSDDLQGEVVLDADGTALNALFDRIQSALANNKTRVNLDLPALLVGSPPTGHLSMPVTSLHGDSSGMDRDLQNALKAGRHPEIEFVYQRLQQAALQWDPQDHQTALKLSIIGELSMAGVARPIAMDMIVVRNSSRHFLVHARSELSMSDYDVTPPGTLFGLIKAGDQVVVTFDLDFVLQDHAAGPQPAVQAATVPSY